MDLNLRRLCFLIVPVSFIILFGAVYIAFEYSENSVTQFFNRGNIDNSIFAIIFERNYDRKSKNLTEIINKRNKKLLLLNASCIKWFSIGENMKIRKNIVINENDKTILQNVIKQKCYDDKVVPNVVHYVWLGTNKTEMTFYQFLSVYSCHKYLHPCLILFHGETLPYGTYWDLLQTVVPNIVHVNRTLPTRIEGIKIKHTEHKADIVRNYALRDYGGIYMDKDSVALKPMDDFRNYNFTLSIKKQGVMAIETMLSAPNAEFLNIWLKHYISFDPNDLNMHSVILPYRLSKRYPSLIHVVKNCPFHYECTGNSLTYGKQIWGKKYAMPMHYNKSLLFNETIIRQMNSPLGEISRHVLFDDRNICKT